LLLAGILVVQIYFGSLSFVVAIFVWSDVVDATQLRHEEKAKDALLLIK
jgi:hypothetical protein